METTTIIISFFVGIGLAASAGFRVFVPLLALSLAAKFGFDLNEEWAWVGSWTAIITLSVATFIEIIGYYIPWVDNMLDSIALPMAGIAGTLLMGFSLGNIDSEFIQWGLAIVAGGGTATAVKGSAAGTRLASTATTGGAGNFVVSSTETFAAGILSILAVVAPIIAFILVLVVFYFIYKGWHYIKGKNKRSSIS